MDGLLLIDKPTGLTSFDVVRQVRKLARERKVGHTGTLDPAATGLLAVTVGACTRLAQFVNLEPKVYRFTIQLGTETDTCDDEGEVVETGPANIDRAAMEHALASFVGIIQQVPPRYSAVHVDGKRAHELARAGVDFEVPSREVRVDRFELLGDDGSAFEVEVECGGGTYMRALARDVARVVGTVGHARQIRRERVGAWTVEEASALESLTPSNIGERLRSPLEMVSSSMPTVRIGAAEASKIRHGNFVKLTDRVEGGLVAVVDGSGLLAVAAAVVDEDGDTLLKPRRVLQ